VKFNITDDLPDMGSVVFREEILILMGVAPSLSPAFAEAIEVDAPQVREAVSASAGSAVRSREYATTG